ncbi:MAG: hypothetical protein NTX52_13405, partial [Planctomycetota bacterium]|nr:hypothetical protein [Planctomycetota bacterium]
TILAVVNAVVLMTALHFTGIPIGSKAWVLITLVSVVSYATLSTLSEYFGDKKLWSTTHD